MSNKKISSTESVSTVDQDSSVLNGTATSPLKSSLYLVGFTLAQICYRRN